MGLGSPQAPRPPGAGLQAGHVDLARTVPWGRLRPQRASCTPTSTAGAPRPRWTRRRRPRHELGRGTAGHKDRAPRPCAARPVLSGPRSLRCETITSASRASRGKGSGAPPGGGGTNARSPHAGGPAWRPRTGAPHGGSAGSPVGSQTLLRRPATGGGWPGPPAGHRPTCPELRVQTPRFALTQAM